MSKIINQQSIQLLFLLNSHVLYGYTYSLRKSVRKKQLQMLGWGMTNAQKNGIINKIKTDAHQTS